MLLSLVAFSAVHLCIYRPLQNQFERRLALPLRVGQKVVIVAARRDAGTVRQGDWVAYRIPGALGTMRTWRADLALARCSGAGRPGCFHTGESRGQWRGIPPAAVHARQRNMDRAGKALVYL